LVGVPWVARHGLEVLRMGAAQDAAWEAPLMTVLQSCIDEGVIAEVEFPVGWQGDLRSTDFVDITARKQAVVDACVKKYIDHCFTEDESKERLWFAENNEPGGDSRPDSYNGPPNSIDQAFFDCAGPADSGVDYHGYQVTGVTLVMARPGPGNDGRNAELASFAGQDLTWLSGRVVDNPAPGATVADIVAAQVADSATCLALLRSGDYAISSSTLPHNELGGNPSDAYDQQALYQELIYQYRELDAADYPFILLGGLFMAGNNTDPSRWKHLINPDGSTRLEVWNQDRPTETRVVDRPKLFSTATQATLTGFAASTMRAAEFDVVNQVDEDTPYGTEAAGWSPVADSVPGRMRELRVLEQPEAFRDGKAKLFLAVLPVAVGGEIITITGKSRLRRRSDGQQFEIVALDRDAATAAAEGLSIIRVTVKEIAPK
jgi:hypothetical protein